MQSFKNVEEFYSDNSARRRSPEADYGVHWKLEGWPNSGFVPLCRPIPITPRPGIDTVAQTVLAWYGRHIRSRRGKCIPPLSSGTGSFSSP